MKSFVTKDSVYVRSSNNTNKMMKHLLIALIPIILFAFYKNGIYPFIKGDSNFIEMLYPLIFIGVGVLTNIIIEAAYDYIILGVKKEKLKEHLYSSYAIFSGLLLSLILPINMPLYILVLGVTVGVVVGKLIFGGFSKNIFNPALIGYIFLFFVFSTNFTSVNYFNNHELNTLINVTPISNLSSLDFVGSYTEVVSPYGNLLDLFVGFKPGSNGEVSILLCLLALGYLAYNKVIKTKIPVIYIATVFLMTAFIGYFNHMDLWYPMFSVMTGGLVFVAVFMATDPVTSPVTNVGQIIYAVSLGIITVLLRYLTPITDGFFIAILIMNGLVLFIDRLGARCKFDHLKTIIVMIIAVIVLGIATYISNTNLTAIDDIIIDSNFNIVNKTVNNSLVYYVVTEKCYSNVKAKVTLNKAGKITDILILENSEPNYDIIVNDKYTDQLIKYQNKIDDLKDIKEVKVTTKGLKKMVSNVLLDYKNNGV